MITITRKETPVKLDVLEVAQSLGLDIERLLECISREKIVQTEQQPPADSQENSFKVTKIVQREYNVRIRCAPFNRNAARARIAKSFRTSSFNMK